MDVELLARPCNCGSLDKGHYRCYQGDKQELYGLLCEACGMEYLQEKYIETDTGVHVLYDNRKFFYRGKGKVTTTVLSGSRTVDQVQAGSHLRWNEGIGSEMVTVDAIVESSEGNLLVSVVMLQKMRFCELTVGRMLIDLSKVVDLQIIEYKPGCDPPELVRARAMSCCSGVEVCNIFTTKTKTFAEYCKCGPGQKWRQHWLGGSKVTMLLKTLLGSSWITGTEEDCQSVIERGRTKQRIKAGILFVMDGTAVAFELQDLIDEKQGDIKAETYLDSFIARFVGVLRDSDIKVSGAVASGAPGGGIGSLELPAITTTISFFIGSVIKGSVINAPQKLVGSSLGRVFGHVIHLSVKRGDETVSIEDLHPGDQVVLPGHLSHPRCHAIVVSININTSKLKLIRNTYERGVVEEWVEVAPTVLRVNYDENTRLGQEVIARARSKLGENKYNILWYNCKHFAAWCKQK